LEVLVRLLLRFRTGNHDNPDDDVERAQVEKVLIRLGWLPRDGDFAKEKLDAVVLQMPNGIQAEIRAGDPLVFTPRPGQWGIVSSETHNELKVRLVNDDLDTLKSVATTVVDRLPDAFETVMGHKGEFDSEVAIRRFDSEIRIVVGQIEEYHALGFWRYSRTLRRGQAFVALTLVALTVLVMGASVPMYVLAPDGAWEYWRGYLDRGATALLTAALITLVNINFEFRHWRNEKQRINWGTSPG
jgi:hypothetical protein